MATTEVTRPRPIRDDGPAGSRLPSLTGMRFVAAALVFAFHVAYTAPINDAAAMHRYAGWVRNTGTMGVEFFFVLSGFVLAWTARSSDTARAFWRRRVAKVYPNHLTAFVLAGILAVWAGRQLDLRHALPNLFLLHAWIPRGPDIFSMDDVSWSLSCEALFYLAFPLVYRYARRISDERLWWWAGGIVAVIIVVPPLVFGVLPTQPTWMHSPIVPLWFVYVFPPVRLLDFALGIVMARIVRAGRFPKLGLLPASALVVVGYVITLQLPVQYGYVAGPIIPLALVIAAAAAADLNGTRTVFATRAMVWLGEISFAFYLLHWLLLQNVPVALGRGRTVGLAGGVVLVLTELVVAVGLAWVLHTVVEQPAMRRLSGRRSAAAQPLPPAEQRLTTLAEEASPASAV